MNQFISMASPQTVMLWQNECTYPNPNPLAITNRKMVFAVLTFEGTKTTKQSKIEEVQRCSGGTVHAPLLRL